MIKSGKQKISNMPLEKISGKKLEIARIKHGNPTFSLCLILLHHAQSPPYVSHIGNIIVNAMK